jgi:adenylate kinase family enzyme
MQRVGVIGCGGSGKTTLARQLSELLGLPVIHIDSHYWREVAGRSMESTPEQWIRTHADLIAGERWVIDGMKLGVLADRLAAADTVIYLDLPTATCLTGVLRRRLRFRGQLRPDLGVYDRISWQFIRWIVSFRRQHRPTIIDLLAEYHGTIVVLRSPTAGPPIPTQTRRTLTEPQTTSAGRRPPARETEARLGAASRLDRRPMRAGVLCDCERLSR